MFMLIEVRAGYKVMLVIVDQCGACYKVMLILVEAGYKVILIPVGQDEKNVNTCGGEDIK